VALFILPARERTAWKRR